MSRRCISDAVAVLAMVLVFSVSAQAGASRTFVATTGNDSNTSANCGATTPCRTFGAALSVTNAGGEVVVVNSGGYGPASITEPVIITAIDVDASISVTESGGIGLAINTPGAVTITGLNLHGEATGVYGVYVAQVGFLRLYNMLIENFTLTGVFLNDIGNLAIYGSTISDNGDDGLIVNTLIGSAEVYSTSFDHNAIGLLSDGRVTATDCSAEYNSIGFMASSGTLTLSNDRAIFNTVGLAANMAGTLYFTGSLVSHNEFSYQIDSPGTMAGTGTSLIVPGQMTRGTLSTPVALH